jgi:hypothetical protein
LFNKIKDTQRNHHAPVLMVNLIISSGSLWNNWNSKISGGDVKWYSHSGKTAVDYKEHTVCHSSFTLQNLLEKHENSHSLKHVYMNDITFVFAYLSKLDTT